MLVKTFNLRLNMDTMQYDDLVVGLCFGGWFDVAVCFSFGGVVSLLLFLR